MGVFGSGSTGYEGRPVGDNHDFKNGNARNVYGDASGKYTQCLTKSDFVPKKEEPGQECEKMSVNVSGNTVSWSIKCKSKEGIMKGTGKITYKGNTYEGVMDMTFPNQDGGEGKMTSNMTGKWMGNCK